MGCFVRGDKNYMGCFVRGGKLMLDVLSGVAKNGMGCFVPGCFVLHSVLKQGLMCRAQGHNAVPPMRLEPATTQSQVNHSTCD